MLLTALTVVACALALTEGAAVPRSLQEARASHADTMVPVARGGMAATSKPNSVAQRYVTAEQLDRKLDAKFAELKEFLKGITQEAKPTSHTGIHSDSQTVCDCYLQLLDTADFQWFCSSQDCYEAMLASISSEVETNLLKAKEQSSVDLSSGTDFPACSELEPSSFLNLDPNMMHCDCHYCTDLIGNLVHRCLSDNAHFICAPTQLPMVPAAPVPSSRPYPSYNHRPGQNNQRPGLPFATGGVPLNATSASAATSKDQRALEDELEAASNQ